MERLQKYLPPWWFNSNWTPANFLTNGVSGSGVIGWATYYMQLETGSTSGSYVYVYKASYGLGGVYSWNKKRYFGVYVYFSTYSYQNIHVVTGNSPTTGSTNTSMHIGFKLINADLYGTVADGTTESTLLLETLSADGYRRLECILTPTVECRFYVNGVDKGAITTNLPIDTTDAKYDLFIANHNTEAINKIISIYESRTLQLE